MSGQTAATADVIDTILGLTPGSEVYELRRRREEVLQHSQGSYDVLLSSKDPGALTLPFRALVALKVAESAGHKVLTAHYRDLLKGRDAALETAAPSPLLAAILKHTALLATSPGNATRDDLKALTAAGLSEREIVALSQLIAFVSYQVRAAVGLALLQQEKANG